MERSKHTDEEYFTQALKNGKLVHISEVQNGLDCGCICPSCETPVVAYNNPKNKNKHHFKHHSKRNCYFYYETMLHYMAKEIIAKDLRLTVPNHKFMLSDYAWSYGYNLRFEKTPTEMIEPCVLEFQSVEVEKYQNGIKPDLICGTKGKELHIEIAVTHFIDEKKEQKIKAINVTSLEIDLSGFERDTHEEKLRNALSGNIELMKWFNNKSIELKRQKAESLKHEIRSFIKSKSNEKKVYGRSNTIYKCPISSKENNASLSNCRSCRYRSYEHEQIVVVNWEDRQLYENITVGCIGIFSREFDILLRSKGISVGRNKAFEK